MSLALVPLLATLGPVAATALLCAVVLAETALPVGFFLPGDSLLFAAGLLSATGALPVPVLVLVVLVWIAAVVGDQIGFLAGRRAGTRLVRVARRGRVHRLVTRHLGAAERFFDRHGARTVVLARFVPAARTFAPFVAGAARMSHRRFTTYNVGGGLVWSAVMILGGFFLGGVPFVAAHVELTTLAIIAVSLAPAAVAAVRGRRVGARRDAQPSLATVPRERPEHATTS
ncbi:MAG: VTT domain-containing protein [Aeromicrobium erythreum]